MQQIIFFFIRNKNLLLFLFLFFVSIALTINTHSYHKNKFSNSANTVSGGIFEFRARITDYFDLKRQNQLLQDENQILRTKLSNIDVTRPTLDDSVLSTKYIFRKARVIKNSVSKNKNYLTIDKGTRDSVRIDMGVISPQGVVGIIHATSSRYASVQSLLNTNSQVSARLKKSGHFGTLIWEGQDPYHSWLIDVSSQVKLAVGDTVVTDGRSTIFPEGLLIGTVRDVQLEDSGDYYRLKIGLSTDLTALSHVYLVQNNDRDEIIELENSEADAEQ